MTPADVLAELGRGVGWGIEQAFFTMNGWWILGGLIVGWAVLVSWADSARVAGYRRAEKSREEGKRQMEEAQRRGRIEAKQRAYDEWLASEHTGGFIDREDWLSFGKLIGGFSPPAS